MAVWLVRAGRYGEQEERALKHGLVTIGWKSLPSLKSVKSREELIKVYEKAYPDAKKNKMSNEVSQIWTFINKIKDGDLIVLPLKTRAAIAIGNAQGEYEYRKDLGDDIHHVRVVKWLVTDLPRTSFDQDLLYSFGAFMTVCQIKRNDAERRIQAILKGKKVPVADAETEQEERLDIEQLARDQIINFINQKFKGHELAKLVEAVMKSRGYTTKISEPGPDGGVDILAGLGPMGFDEPRISVQVKSSNNPVDISAFNGLLGTLKTFNADQALLVSWGGFKQSVLQEARKNFFIIRLWDSNDLLEEILKNYDNFSDTLKAELPLKRIWSIVPEEE